jgi:hypothetical protein
MDLFCPNCRYYFGETAPIICPKCSYRISREEAPSQDGILKDYHDGDLRGSGDDGGPMYKCPTCGNRLTHYQGEVLNFDLLGKSVTIENISAFKMNIAKRAITQVQTQFDSWTCVKGHKYYNNYKENVKKLCPGCKGGMVKFGDAVVSCKSCSINLTKESFVYVSGEELLRDEGWVSHPEPFGTESDEEATPAEDIVRKRPEGDQNEEPLQELEKIE